ncbi:dTMP kinase [Parasediminibacterium sp. JCM 36343]|uniref:dTMP kinase n=1 Tax=Parasediminibacterium sp. JCM 36343 TaxID=3374279 RepID=UPI00397D2575
MKQQLFIAFEGIDGSGKSTQVKLLAEKLRQEGHKVYSTFEPTDNPIGSLIRNIFKGRMTADHKTIAALNVADRLDHLYNDVNGIIKKLEEGYTVITDRYYFSSYAYHGVHVDIDWVIAANAMSAAALKPAIHIFIDVPPALSMERLNSTRGTIDLYETLDNLEQVRAKFMEAFEKLKATENIVFIDGNQTIAAIAKDVWENVSDIAK